MCKLLRWTQSGNGGKDIKGLSRLDSFSSDTGLVLRQTLVKSGSGPMPVLVVNPNPYPVRVGRKSVVGNVSPVDTILDWSPADRARSVLDDGRESSALSTSSACIHADFDELEDCDTPLGVHNLQVGQSTCSEKAASDPPHGEELTPQGLAPELAKLVDVMDLTDSQRRK